MGQSFAVRRAEKFGGGIEVRATELGTVRRDGFVPLGPVGQLVKDHAGGAIAPRERDRGTVVVDVEERLARAVPRTKARECFESVPGVVQRPPQGPHDVFSERLALRELAVAMAGWLGCLRSVHAAAL